MPAVRPLVLTVAAALLVASGCGSGALTEGGGGANEDNGTRVVHTDKGKVTVPEKPKRIVVLNSALAGYLYAMDVPVHGTIPLNPTAKGFPEFWADEAEQDDTMMVPWSNDGFDLEALLAEQPDLIIAGGQGFPGSQAADAYQDLSEIAPTVLVSTELSRWDQELEFIADEILGMPQRADKLMRAYEDRANAVRQAIDPPPTPVSYLLMLSNREPWSIPESASLPTTLADIGIDSYPVLEKNPKIELFGSGDSFGMTEEKVSDLIVGRTIFVLGFQSDVTSVEELSQEKVYAQLPAFESGHAYDLPYWAHRADYYATMALLDHIEEEFG